MTLADWQSGVCAMVQKGVSGQTRSGPGGNLDAKLLTDTLDLTDQERRSILALEGDRGYALTCHIIRWWRSFKIRAATPLTCAQLEGESEDRIQEHIGLRAFTSFFFLEEAIGFLDYLLEDRLLTPITRSIVRFERALLSAHVERASILATPNRAEPAAIDAAIDVDTAPQLMCRKASGVTIVQFDRPPEQLLGSLLAGVAVSEPALGPECAIVIAPTLPALWRPAPLAEARLISVLEKPTTLETALRRAKATFETAAALIEEQLLSAEISEQAPTSKAARVPSGHTAASLRSGASP